MKTVKNFVLLTFVFLSVATANFAQSGGKPSITEQSGQVTEFDVNGLKVLVKRRTNAPTVTAGLFVRGGSRNITDKNAGIENLTLSVATEASQKYSREAVRRELSRTGSSIGASVSNDYSAVSMITTRQNFDKTWDMFTDLMLHPTFAQEDIERDRAQISTGLRERETNNDNFLEILQDRVIYANHPYANDVSGNLENIGRFTAKELSDYHKKIMETSRLLLVVVGDIDPKEVQTRVAATFGKLPRGNYKDTKYPALDFSKETLDITTRTLPTNYVQGVFNAPALDSPDYYAMRVAVTVLQSRIYQEVRNVRQLSYAPNAELENYASNVGNIYVTAVNANEAVKVMLNEVNNLKTRQISEEAIASISGHFLTLHFMGQETNAAQAGELAKYELIGGGWKNSFDFLDKIRSVTPAEVQAAAQKYMKNIRFVVIGDPKAIDRKIFLPNS